MIDLSASLGLKTPLDSALNINPVYYPNRFHKLRYLNAVRCQEKSFADEAVDVLHWDSFEEHIMAAYYAAFNDPSVRALASQYDFKMPTPFKFHKFVNDRRESEDTRQNKEAFRNSIVAKMEDSKNFNKAVVAITGALGAN
uniref:Uncharacterized protein n=1 Tax=Paramoeba aestuarina TaxID=180227 RepID=A0A7S4N3U3_9EUKA